MLRLNLVMLILFLPALVMPALVAPSPSVDRRVWAMGTELSLHVEGPGDLVKASEAALAEVARVEAACSTWRPQSEWSRLNAAQGAAVPLAPEWVALLERVQTWSRNTGGTFDPVLMALVRVWGLRQGGVVPEGSALSAAREASGSPLLQLDPLQGMARMLHPLAGVEEGGFLKGYALDVMRKASGASAGWMDFGGQLMVWGRPCRASIADPKDRRQPRIHLNVQDASLAGSGTSERGGHILDPRSGEPCPGWGSTAVVAAEALEADVLSTALYVMGPDAGLMWADREGVAAAFLLNDGSIRLSRRFQSLNPHLIPREPR